MYALIDYYSFTIPVKEGFGKAMFDADKHAAIQVFLGLFLDVAFRDTLRENWEAERGKGFYQLRLRHTVSDVAISFGSVNAHIFVELAGKACANFDSLDQLLPLIERTKERATRIDFAVDIKCAVSPRDFISERSNKSFKSSGNVYSPTGATEYLGGRASERMVRVYRYYEPHPRNEFLRVEAEYKGDAAKASAEHLTRTSVLQATLDAHQPFGWLHPCWEVGNTTSTRIPYRHYRPETASTIYWLYGDVVTALRKAVSQELIDFEEWLKYVREGLKDEK